MRLGQIKKTMARRQIIKADKSDNESTLQGRYVVWKRKNRLKCKKCGVKLDHDKGTVPLMWTIRTCKYVYK